MLCVHADNQYLQLGVCQVPRDLYCVVVGTSNSWVLYSEGVPSSSSKLQVGDVVGTARSIDRPWACLSLSLSLLSPVCLCLSAFLCVCVSIGWRGLAVCVHQPSEVSRGQSRGARRWLTNGPVCVCSVSVFGVCVCARVPLQTPQGGTPGHAADLRERRLSHRPHLQAGPGGARLSVCVPWRREYQGAHWARANAARRSARIDRGSLGL